MGRDRDHHRSSRKKSKKRSSSKHESSRSSSSSSSSKLNIGSLQQKLKSLNNTQESVQSVSLWIIHHKHHVKHIVKAWLEEIKQTAVAKRLILMYLANDVIQNSRRKGITTFVDAFGNTFAEAVALCRDDSIRKSIERLFKIWEQRNIYDSEAVEKFQDAISSERDAQVKANTQILAEYKPDELPEGMENLVHFEGEVDLKRKQLSNLNVDVTSTEAIMQLKDRAGGKRFSKHFEDATNKLDDYVQSLGKEVEMRQGLLELLDKSVVFYEAQFGEAKIVANAYKNFGTRVGNLKKRLGEYRKQMPNDSFSPLPSPTSDAPSPGATPPRDPNQDTTELEDMDMSDEEHGSKNVGSIAATSRSRDKSTKASKKQAPLASLPGPPIVGQPIATIAGQVGKYADDAQDSYSPGSDASAPSPEGTPEGLNLSPSSNSQSAPDITYEPVQPSYQATSQSLLPPISSSSPFPSPVAPLPTAVSSVPPASYPSVTSSSYNMYTTGTQPYSAPYAAVPPSPVSLTQSTAPYNSNTYYQSETPTSTVYSATPASQPTSPPVYSQNYTPTTYSPTPFYSQQNSQEGGYSTAPTTTNPQYIPPPTPNLYSPTKSTVPPVNYAAGNSFVSNAPPLNYGTNYTPSAPPSLPQDNYKPMPPRMEEAFMPSDTQYTQGKVNYSNPQLEYQAPRFPSGSEGYSNDYATDNYKPYNNQNSLYPDNDNDYTQRNYGNEAEFDHGINAEGPEERELMQQAKTNPIGFLTRIITASKQTRNAPRPNLLSNLTALKTVPTVDEQTFKSKLELEQKQKSNDSDHPSDVASEAKTDEEKSIESAADSQDSSKDELLQPRSILKRRKAPDSKDLEDILPLKREKLKSSIALGAFLSSLQQDEEDKSSDEEDKKDTNVEETVPEDAPEEEESTEKSSAEMDSPRTPVNPTPISPDPITPDPITTNPITTNPIKTEQISTIMTIGNKLTTGPTPGPPPGPPPSNAKRPGPPPGPPPANAKRGPLLDSPPPIKSLVSIVKQQPVKQPVKVEPTSAIPVLGAPIAKPFIKRRLSSVVVPAKTYTDDTNWEDEDDYGEDYEAYNSMGQEHYRGRYDDYRQRRRSMEMMEPHRYPPYAGGRFQDNRYQVDRYEDDRFRYNRGPPFHGHYGPPPHRPPLRGGRPPLRGGRPPPYYRY